MLAFLRGNFRAMTGRIKPMNALQSSTRFAPRAAFLFVILATFSARAAWLEPALVRDINTNNKGSAPWNIVSFGSNVLFQARVSSFASATWITDGTVAGTEERPFLELSHGAVEWNGLLFFGRYQGATGTELWTSDGTFNGTHMVREIESGFQNGLAYILGATSNWVFFVGFDEAHGPELWRSDGTSNGTVMVKDIYPGPSGGFSWFSFFPPVEVINDRLWFYALHPTEGRMLWVSDGTESNTVPIDYPGRVPTSYEATVLGGLSNRTFFVGTTTNEGVELWVTEGTPESTRLLKDINPGANYSYPRAGAALSNVFLFVADEGYSPDSRGRELWRTDGTDEGTVMVKDIMPGNAGGAWLTDSLFSFGGFVYFRAADTNGPGLWRSDGTEGGTTLLQLLPANDFIFRASEFVAAGDHFYFLVNQRLWKSDGTTKGTTQVSDAEVLYGLSRVGDAVVFVGLDPRFGYEMWRSDGTSNGTGMLLDLNEEAADSLPGLFVEANGHVFFGASQKEYEGNTGLWKTDLNGSNAQLVAPLRVLSLAPWSNGVASLVVATNGFDLELWTSDGTTTEFVKRLDDGFAYQPTPLLNVNGILFTQPYSFDRALWRSDGTADGTHVVWTGSWERNVSELVSFADKAYFGEDDFAGGAQLWKSDGTISGTEIVLTLTNATQLTHLTAVGQQLFFLATVPGGLALYKTDGTEASTVSLAFLTNASPYDFHLSLIAGGDVLYFTYVDQNNGSGLWRSDGTTAGTYMVKLFTSAYGSSFSALTYMSYTGGKLYFQAYHPFQHELWRSDGTSNGTVKIASVSGGNVVEVNGLGFFQSDELYVTDGTSGGTRPLTEVQASNTFTFYYATLPIFAASNGRIFFPMKDTAHGIELWSLLVPAAPRVQDIHRVGDTSTLTITGASGLTNIFEFSTDFTQWSAFATNRVPESGALSVQHTNGAGRVFYRSRQLLP